MLHTKYMGFIRELCFQHILHRFPEDLKNCSDLTRYLCIGIPGTCIIPCFPLAVYNSNSDKQPTLTFITIINNLHIENI